MGHVEFSYSLILIIKKMLKSTQIEAISNLYTMIFYDYTPQSLALKIGRKS